MPKDATKNVDRYKIGGGHLNEYEVEQDKAAERKQKPTNKKPHKAAAKKSPKKR